MSPSNWVRKVSYFQPIEYSYWVVTSHSLEIIHHYSLHKFTMIIHTTKPFTLRNCIDLAVPSARAVLGVGLRPLACWDHGLETRSGHGCLSLVNVVCCQLEVCASGWSLIQRSRKECGVSECDLVTSTVRRPWLTIGCCSTKIKFY
jgi:hypothetical protein